MQLQQEFLDLYKESKLSGSNYRFIQDGIINHALYADQKIKVLFIAKEHNDLDKNASDDEYKCSYSYWWNGSEDGSWPGHVRYGFSHRLSEWAYGILHGFPDYNEIDYNKKHRALKSIAFINVKKTSGEAVSNSKIIYEYIATSRELLHRQIREISPTIIVSCLRYRWYVEPLFGAMPNDIGFTTWEGIPTVNFYHPSSRLNKLYLYNLLKETVNSITQ